MRHDIQNARAETAVTPGDEHDARGAPPSTPHGPHEDGLWPKGSQGRRVTLRRDADDEGERAPPARAPENGNHEGCDGPQEVCRRDARERE